MRKSKEKKHYVLALNRAWLPVDIITHKDAFRLLCKGHAKALETVHGSYMMHTIDSWIDMHMHENYKKLNTVSMEIPVPEIIILTEYDKIPERFIKFSKSNLLIRDDYSCIYCGCSLDAETATIDHIHPVSKGGTTSWDNCAISCMRCNHNKGDALPVGKFKPNKDPKEPTHFSPLYQMRKKTKGLTYPDSWKKFLFH
jgi:5-methylcytosine-specific restriction endonuclease McrA